MVENAAQPGYLIKPTEAASINANAPGTDPRAPWVDKNLRCHTKLDGFDLHAGVTVPGHAYDRREALFRYVGILTGTCSDDLEREVHELADGGEV